MLHLASAVGFGTYFLYSNARNPSGVELSVREHTLHFTHDVSGDRYLYTSEQTGVVTIQSIQALLVSFFIITALFHLYYYLADGIVSNQYTEMIRNRNNYIRWIEYSITATIMLYIIAYLSGVKDQNIYYLITATNIAMMAQGQWIEVAAREQKDWITPMVTAFGLLLTEFYIIYRNFQKRNTAEQVDGFKQPSWMPTSVLIMFLFFLCFGFVSLICAWSGKEYYYIEVAYIMASFIAKNWLGRYVCVFVIP